MAKKKAVIPSQASDALNNDAKYIPVDNENFEGYEVESAVSVAQWTPNVGDKRAFMLLGWDTREGDNGSMYNIYKCRDLKTNEMFSLIGGGLMDYFVREGNIVNGDALGVTYCGMVELKDKQGRAKQWHIVKLKAPK